MNKYLKIFIYTIFLMISMVGELISTLFGLVGVSVALVSASRLEFGFALLGLLMALIGILGQRFFHRLDPAPMYYNHKDW